MIKSSFKTDTPITGLDIFPTLMEAVGHKMDGNSDGISLFSFLTKREALPERSLVWHFPIYLQGVDPIKDDARDSLFRTRPGSVIRKGNWKLHEYFEDNSLELYQLNNDLGERKNLTESLS